MGVQGKPATTEDYNEESATTVPDTLISASRSEPSQRRSTRSRTSYKKEALALHAMSDSGYDSILSSDMDKIESTNVLKERSVNAKDKGKDKDKEGRSRTDEKPTKLPSSKTSARSESRSSKERTKNPKPYGKNSDLITQTPGTPRSNKAAAGTKTMKHVVSDPAPAPRPLARSPISLPVPYHHKQPMAPPERFLPNDEASYPLPRTSGPRTPASDDARELYAQYQQPQARPSLAGRQNYPKHMPVHQASQLLSSQLRSRFGEHIRSGMAPPVVRSNLPAPVYSQMAEDHYRREGMASQYPIQVANNPQYSRRNSVHAGVSIHQPPNSTRDAHSAYIANAASVIGSEDAYSVRGSVFDESLCEAPMAPPRRPPLQDRPRSHERLRPASVVEPAREHRHSYRESKEDRRKEPKRYHQEEHAKVAEKYMDERNSLTSRILQLEQTQRFLLENASQGGTKSSKTRSSNEDDRHSRTTRPSKALRSNSAVDGSAIIRLEDVARVDYNGQVFAIPAGALVTLPNNSGRLSGSHSSGSEYTIGKSSRDRRDSTPVTLDFLKHTPSPRGATTHGHRRPKAEEAVRYPYEQLPYVPAIEADLRRSVIPQAAPRRKKTTTTEYEYDPLMIQGHPYEGYF